MKRIAMAFVAIVIAISVGAAADWPQWQGPDRDKKSSETGLLKEWPKGGPKLEWTFNNAGLGYSSPSIVGDRLYMSGAREGISYLYAIDVSNGKEIWKAKIGPAFTFKSNSWGDGPRAAPTVSSGMVYALGGGGELICAKASDGAIVWRAHMQKDLGGEVNPIGGGPKKIGWGYTWAPLIDGDNVICVPGGPKGQVAALNRLTGKPVWRSTDLAVQAVYSSPIVAEIHGSRQYIVMNQNGVAGVDATNGKLLWQYKRSRPYPDVVIPTPIYQDNHVYITAGYGAGCDLVEITRDGGKFGAKKVYSNKFMKNTLGGVVLVDGYIYGASERRGWVCQEWKKGKLAWSQKNVLGTGSVIYADGHLYCYDENDGVVALLEANSKEYKEKSRFTIPQKTKMRPSSGRNWTHPVIAHGKLYIRDQELLFCFSIK